MAIQPSHSPRALNLLDRQGYGAVLYVSASRQLRLETASGPVRGICVDGFSYLSVLQIWSNSGSPCRIQLCQKKRLRFIAARMSRLTIFLKWRNISIISRLMYCEPLFLSNADESCLMIQVRVPR
uniref:Uncharacterized protein n=1 Tax=Spongospora subterranea TaxID=70186 RepID=A0A0H5RBR0_9EUKA|eukprot:CRZ11665.1 hypothetical protein [Spongospora subterranea]